MSREETIRMHEKMRKAGKSYQKVEKKTERLPPPKPKEEEKVEEKPEPVPVEATED